MIGDKRKLREQINGLLGDINDMQHKLNAEELRSLTMYKAVLASQRGIKRLKRKLEVRDAYVKAAELLLATCEGTINVNTQNDPIVNTFILARQNLGLVKKPRRDSVRDKDIDTSDIPELGPNFFEGAIPTSPGEDLVKKLRRERK